MALVSNDFGEICLYHACLNGVVTDYILNFSHTVSDLNVVVNDIYDLVEKLFETYNGALVKARMVAKVSYLHVNEGSNEQELRYYHFPSFSADSLDVDENLNDWVTRHLLRIIGRLDTFHANGSNLLLNRIEHIHICVSKWKST